VERCKAGSVTIEHMGADTLLDKVAALLKRNLYDEALQVVATGTRCLWWFAWFL